MKGITFVWCFVLFSATFALPAIKSETESEATKPDPVLVEIEMPADEKPTDNSKPSELAVDPKPMEAKPTEQTKPIEASSPTTTDVESAPMSPSRPQLLYDQRQDGKYNIRADLENFVILVVPSSGNSLLDLLKRSSQRQQQQQQQHNKRLHHTKHHKKYHSVSASVKPSEGKGYQPDGEEAAAAGFIEGRTPYHVDIQSDEILPPAPYGVRSMNGNAATIADLPLVNLDDNTASTSSDASDATVILSSVTAGDSSTKADSDLANAQWELTLLGAEEQCGPDRRRDSYGVCQFVPADYATT